MLEEFEQCQYNSEVLILVKELCDHRAKTLHGTIQTRQRP